MSAGHTKDSIRSSVAPLTGFAGEAAK
jgi:hypothetical protein